MNFVSKFQHNNFSHIFREQQDAKIAAQLADHIEKEEEERKKILEKEDKELAKLLQVRQMLLLMSEIFND